MKFTCDRQQLQKGLSIVQKATDAKSNILVLRNVLMNISGEKLELTGYDHRLGIRTAVDCQAENSGSITCPCDLLTDILNVIDEDRVRFELEDETMNVQAGKFFYKLNCVASEDFPNLPEEETDGAISMKAAALRKGIRRALIATDETDPRVYMGGVYFEIEDKKLRMVSTDGRRLSLVEAEGEVSGELKIVVPARTLNELSHILPDKEEEIKITPGKKSISFAFGQVFMVSRLIEADYPNYKRAVPTEYISNARVGRQKFQNALRAASVMAKSKDAMGMVEVETKDDCIKFSAVTVDIGSAALEIEAQKKGKDMKIAYNIRYVMDFLNVVDSDEVVIDFTKETGPAVFHTDTPDFSYILMPIRV